MLLTQLLLTVLYCGALFVVLLSPKIFALGHYWHWLVHRSHSLSTVCCCAVLRSGRCGYSLRLALATIYKCSYFNDHETVSYLLKGGGGGGGTDLEGGMGMCGPEDLLFTPLLPLTRVPFEAKESVHKTPFWENLEILASTAAIFVQILALKPPNFENFSSQAP